MRRLLAEINSIKVRSKFFGLYDAGGAGRISRAGHDPPAPGTADAKHDPVLFEFLTGGLKIVGMDIVDLHRLTRCKVHLTSAVFLRDPGDCAQFLNRHIAAHGPETDQIIVLLLLAYDTDPFQFVEIDF